MRTFRAVVYPGQDRQFSCEFASFNTAAAVNHIRRMTNDDSVRFQFLSDEQSLVNPIMSEAFSSHGERLKEMFA